MPPLLTAQFIADISQLMPRFLTARIFNICPIFIQYWTSDSRYLTANALFADHSIYSRYLTAHVSFADHSIYSRYLTANALFADRSNFQHLFNICPILDISWWLTCLKLKYPPKYLIIQSFQHQNQLPGLVAEIMHNFQHLSNICPILGISWWLTFLKLKFLPQYVITRSFWHQYQPHMWSYWTYWTVDGWY